MNCFSENNVWNWDPSKWQLSLHFSFSCLNYRVFPNCHIGVEVVLTKFTKMCTNSHYLCWNTILLCNWETHCNNPMYFALLFVLVICVTRKILSDAIKTFISSLSKILNSGANYRCNLIKLHTFYNLVNFAWMISCWNFQLICGILKKYGSKRFFTNPTDCRFLKIFNLLLFYRLYRQ